MAVVGGAESKPDSYRRGTRDDKAGQSMGRVWAEYGQESGRGSTGAAGSSGV